MTIYADYQATTPTDARVLEAMAPFWDKVFGNCHSSDHVMGWHADEAVTRAAAEVGELIGGDGAEIVFTSGATEANNLALVGLARRASPARRRILLSAVEHKSILAAARASAEHDGLRVELVPVDREGALRLDVLADLLDETVLVVSVMAVNNEVGTLQDIPSVAEVLRPHGALLHCDAAQAPCAMDTTDLTSHADLISLSAHKFYGPKGIGALYIRREIENCIEPQIYGGGQQRGLRSGTVAVPLCVGMGAAASILSREAAKERRAVRRLKDAFVREVLRSYPTVAVNGPCASRRHPGNTNLRFSGLNAQDLLAALQPDLAAATGAACASGVPEPSHVLTAMGLSAAQAASSVRFSFGRLTTEHDVREASRLVASAISRLATAAACIP